MQEQLNTESLKAGGTRLLDLATRLLHEGNTRHVVVKQGGRRVVVFPLTVGVVGAIVAPALAAIGAVAALLTNCTIDVEREETKKPAAAAEFALPEADETALSA
jgi:hypothetical protein